MKCIRPNGLITSCLRYAHSPSGLKGIAQPTAVRYLFVFSALRPIGTPPGTPANGKMERTELKRPKSSPTERPCNLPSGRQASGSALSHPMLVITGRPKTRARVLRLTKEQARRTSSPAPPSPVAQEIIEPGHHQEPLRSSSWCLTGT